MKYTLEIISQGTLRKKIGLNLVVLDLLFVVSSRVHREWSDLMSLRQVACMLTVIPKIPKLHRISKLKYASRYSEQSKVRNNRIRCSATP